MHCFFFLFFFFNFFSNDDTPQNWLACAFPVQAGHHFVSPWQSCKCACAAIQQGLTSPISNVNRRVMLKQSSCFKCQQGFMQDWTCVAPRKVAYIFLLFLIQYFTSATLNNSQTDVHKVVFIPISFCGPACKCRVYLYLSHVGLWSPNVQSLTFFFFFFLSLLNIALYTVYIHLLFTCTSLYSCLPPH